MLNLYGTHAKPDNLIAFPQPQQKSNEWYTPAKYIEAAREVMGSIDLDPASCEVANRTVKAARYYSKEDDGLAQEWYGNVWLNPPYGRTNDMKARHQSTIELFVFNLLDTYQSRKIQQAILLIPATIGTKWFAPLWDFTLCFHTGKLNFLAPEIHTCYSHAYGTVFAYLGSNEQRFIDIFSQFGTIAKRVSPPRHTSSTPSLWEGI